MPGGSPIPSDPTSPASGRAPRRSILVIDDDPAVVQLLGRILRNDHDLWLETEPRVALEGLVSGRQVDLILCDVTMPSMSGIEVYTAIRDARPDLAGKLVVMTGGGLPEADEQFILDEQLPTLAKPFRAAELRTFVSDILNNA